ncbi:MAG: tetratricopeptide repeat protein [Nannocystaceae bacterium]|nr:tetratricopeptide repeat protein [Nannocystaceae bacterium]
MTERRDEREPPTPTPSAAASDDQLRTAVQLPPSAEAPGAGARVGRYVVVESLGAGAMGQVVRAYDPRLRREVALKLLKVRGAEAGARIVREAQAMAQLSDPNIVAVYDVELHEGQPFIAMEYVEGTTLAAWLLALVRAWPEVVAVFTGAGRGLMAAHRAGVVHRDFKPANVLVQRGDDSVASLPGRVRVMDFGLALPLGERARRPTTLPPGELGPPGVDDIDDVRTADGIVVGTPAYMAPEQHAGNAVDARSDQYAFCVALWEALAGARPFAARDHVAAKFAGRLDEAAMKRPILPRLRAILVRGLAPDPAARWPDMAALLEALAHDPWRRRWLGVVAGVVALGVVAAVGVGAWRHRAALRACDDDAAAISAVWGPAIADDVAVQLRDSGLPRADDVAVRTRGWLDDYADAWRRTRHEACVAAVEAPAEPAPPRMIACLDERRAALRALTERLQRPDAALLERAVRSAIGLPPLSACRDPAALARRDAAPEPAIEAERAALREALFEVEAQAGAGALALAAERVEPLVTQAQALGFAPLVAHAQLIAANVDARRGRYPQARERLEQAFDGAATAGADELVVEIAGRLVDVVGLDLSEADAGLVWAQLGEIAARRLGLQDDLRMSTLVVNTGNVLSSLGREGEALEHYRRAEAIFIAQLGPEHPEVGGMLSSEGRVYATLGQQALARASLTRAVALLEASYGPDALELAPALDTLARLEFEAAALPQSRALLERVLAIQRAHLGPDHPLISGVLGNLGNVLLEQGDFDAATAAYTESLRIDEAVYGSEHPELAAALSGLGAVARLRGDHDRAVSLNQRALAIEERALGPDHVDVGATLYALGRAQLAQGDRVAAAASLERALAIASATASSPQQLAERRVVLADAIVADDPIRARRLLEQARAALQESGDAAAPIMAEIHARLDAWHERG